MMLLPSPDRRLVTERTLRRDLARIGVGPGTTPVVHSSLSSIGWVLGGAATVAHALLTALTLGDEGTLVMPAATPHCADPATWTAPEIPDAWTNEVREKVLAAGRSRSGRAAGGSEGMALRLPTF